MSRKYKDFAPLDGSEVPKEIDRANLSMEKTEFVQLTDERLTKCLNKPFNDMAKCWRAQWGAKAKCFALILFILCLYIPFGKTPLLWLGTSSQYLRSCIYRIWRTTDMSFVGVSFLSGTTPNITCMYSSELTRLPRAN